MTRNEYTAFRERYTMATTALTGLNEGCNDPKSIEVLSQFIMQDLPDFVVALKTDNEKLNGTKVVAQEERPIDEIGILLKKIDELIVERDKYRMRRILRVPSLPKYAKAIYHGEADFKAIRNAYYLWEKIKSVNTLRISRSTLVLKTRGKKGFDFNESLSVLIEGGYVRVECAQTGKAGRPSETIIVNGTGDKDV